VGLFNLFKKPLIVQDDFFGQLRFMDSKDSSKDYFEGKGFFSPTNNDTEYLIQSDKTGPTSAQKEFYKKLQSDFDLYVTKIKPLIETEFRNWKDEFQIKDFGKEFSLVCMTIPRLDSSPLIWDMSFTTIHDKNHHVTIDFIDYTPNGVLVDG
jgi:hypothetical protein